MKRLTTHSTWWHTGPLHYIPGADRHHVEGLAEAIAEAGRATTPHPIRNLDGYSRWARIGKLLIEVVPPG